MPNPPVGKTDINTQFARVATAAGGSPIAAGAPDDGLAPLVDDQGRLIVVPYSGGPLPSVPVSLSDTAGNVLFKLVKGSAGSLLQAWGSQISGATLWLQLHNLAATPPGAGAIPFVAPIPVLNGGIWSLVFPTELVFSTGIVIAYSTTQPIYTAPAAGGWISAFYR